MKNSQFLCLLSAILSIAGSIIRSLGNGFNVSPSLGAKSGTITSPSGSDANMRTLGDVQPATGTLANIIRQALALAAALKAVVINFAIGQAVVVPTGAAAPAPAGALDIGKFTKDDPSKASSPWTWVSGGDVGTHIGAMESIVATRKPSMSVESLTNALEDVALDPEEFDEDLGMIVYYDQAVGEIKVIGTTDPDYDPSAAYAEEAAFVRTIAAAGSAQFGE